MQDNTMFCAREFQQTVRRPDFQKNYKDIVNDELQHCFIIILRLLVCRIRRVSNKIRFRMTYNYKWVIPFSFFVEEETINTVKKSGVDWSYKVLKSLMSWSMLWRFLRISIFERTVAVYVITITKCSKFV